MNNEEPNPKQAQMIASYITLPFALAVPPIVGWYIGSWIDDYFNIAPYAMYILLILGFIGGIREFYRIVIKYKDTDI